MKKRYFLLLFLIKLGISILSEQPFILYNGNIELGLLKNIVSYSHSTHILPHILTNTYVRVGAPHFPYYDSLIASQLKDFPKEYSLNHVSMDKLFIPRANNTYYYYSGNIMQDEFDQIRSSINMETLFHDLNSLPGLVGTIWMSPPEVHATLHYDAVHNLFIQVTGRKKVLLRPPSDIFLSIVYGRNHPNACQSRWEDASQLKTFENRHIYSIKHEKLMMEKEIDTCKPLPLDHYFLSQNMTFSELTNYQMNSIEVILEPNDILYIPPYWLHEVRYHFIFPSFLSNDILCYLMTDICHR